ncbi:MAG: hypothetical protein V4510_13005 [bacterium]
MTLREKLFVWRAVRAVKSIPSPSGKGVRGWRLHEPSIHDTFRWPGGKVYQDGDWVYKEPV